MPLQKTPGAAIRQPRIALSGEWIAALDLLGQKRGEPNRAEIIRAALLPYLQEHLTDDELQSCGFPPQGGSEKFNHVDRNVYRRRTIPSPTRESISSASASAWVMP
jgi:hypothetical protein